MKSELHDPSTKEVCASVIKTIAVPVKQGFKFSKKFQAHISEFLAVLVVQLWVFGSVGSHFGRFFRMLVPILVGFSEFIIFGSVCSNFGIFSLCIYVLDVFQVGLICVKIHRKQPHNPFHSVVQSKYRFFLPCLSIL